jgi:Arc/MetJ family transcription regulator
MRTNIVIDDDIMTKAMALSGLKTKKETVEKALLTYISITSRKNLMDLKGGVEFADGYDYKAMREGR